MAFKKRFLEFTNNPSAKNAMEAGAYDGEGQGQGQDGHGGRHGGHHKNGSRKSEGQSQGQGPKSENEGQRPKSEKEGQRPWRRLAKGLTSPGLPRRRRTRANFSQMVAEKLKAELDLES